MELDALFREALDTASRSYSPYSHFRVGAAILYADGSVVRGTNVENRSYGLAICAERSAVVSAIAQGKSGIRAVAVACPDADYPVSPCGACRQVLSEFADAQTPVMFGCSADNAVVTTMGALFPYDALHELGR